MNFYIGLYKKNVLSILLLNFLTRKAEICLGTSLCCVDLSLFKSLFPGVGLDHNELLKFYKELYRENVFKNSSHKPHRQKLKLVWKYPQVE